MTINTTCTCTILYIMSKKGEVSRKEAHELVFLVRERVRIPLPLPFVRTNDTVFSEPLQRLLNSLVEKGLIEKKTEYVNGRIVVRYRLTSKGRSTISLFMPDANIREAIDTVLAEEDVGKAVDEHIREVSGFRTAKQVMEKL